jgi:hypothetical protein
MYFIITDKDDMHCNRKFTTGMNEIKRDYCIIYKSLDSHLKVDIYGKEKIISNIYIRFICLDPSSIIDDYRSTWLLINSRKIFVSDKYFIFCPKTIKKFGIKITKDLVSMACANNYIDFLDWYESEYNKLSIDVSSTCNSGLEDYDRLPIDVSSAFGNTDALDFASANGHINVLEWWFKSVLELKYTDRALIWASYNGHINVLEWWFNSGLPLKYSRLVGTSTFTRMDVVAWWKDSGLPLAFESINHTITKIPSKTTSKKKKTSFINKIFSVFSKNKN